MKNFFFTMWLNFIALSNVLIEMNEQRCPCEAYNNNISDCIYYGHYYKCGWNEKEKKCVEFCESIDENNCNLMNSYRQCKWNGKSCVKYNYTCPEYDEEPRINCLDYLDCYENAEGKCKTFTSCGDLSLTICNQWESCILSDDQSSCVNVKCDAIMDKDSCYGKSNYLGKERCVWSTSEKCEIFPDFENCEELSFNENYCKQSNCQWKDGICQRWRCEQGLREYNCGINFFKKDYLIVCAWDQRTKSCIEPKDISEISNNFCGQYTYFTYFLNEDNKCEKCINYKPITNNSENSNNTNNNNSSNNQTSIDNNSTNSQNNTTNSQNNTTNPTSNSSTLTNNTSTQDSKNQQTGKSKFQFILQILMIMILFIY